jgi:RNA polymerase sigma-70 factor (ECF subfamily)
MPEDRLAEEDRFLRALTRRLVSDEHLAEDLAQETWLAALRQSAGSICARRAWLGTVARNFALQSLRGRIRRAAREEAVARPEAAAPSDAALDAGLRARLLAAVEGLDEPYRQAIRLRFFDDLPPTLIAERLGAPVETVRTRLKRALAALARRLAGSAGSGPAAGPDPFAGSDRPRHRARGTV